MPTCCRACATPLERMTSFIVCPECGDKRCPKADDHRNACTPAHTARRPTEEDRLRARVAELEAERDRMAPVAAAVDWYSAEVHELNLEDAIYAYIHPETKQPE